MVSTCKERLQAGMVDGQISSKSVFRPTHKVALLEPAGLGEHGGGHGAVTNLPQSLSLDSVLVQAKGGLLYRILYLVETVQATKHPLGKIDMIAKAIDKGMEVDETAGRGAYVVGKACSTRR